MTEIVPSELSTPLLKSFIHTTLFGCIFSISCCSCVHVNLRCETTLSPCSCHTCLKILVLRPDDATLTAALAAASWLCLSSLCRYHAARSPRFHQVWVKAEVPLLILSKIIIAEKRGKPTVMSDEEDELWRQLKSKVSPNLWLRKLYCC